MRLRLHACAVFLGAAVIAACTASSRDSDFSEGGEGDNKKKDAGDSFGESVDHTDPEATDCASAEAEAIKPPVDVIVSVDQSGSMSDDIANVKANINKLSTFLGASGLDTRVVMIGTVGTGTYDVCVPPPLGGANCASNGDKFRTVNRNVQSNDTLSIILSTLTSPTSTTEWLDFLRPDSIKVFVPITDDDAYSPKAAAFDTQLLAASEVFGTEDARRYVFYPIVGASAFPSKTTCGVNAVNNGSQYLELATLTKGKWFPICSTNFGPVFQDMAKAIAATVACDLAVPLPEDGADIDFDKVNVKVTPSSGKPKDIAQDTSAPCDDGANGWQYNEDRTRVLLCGEACATARADAKTKITVEFGCATRLK